MLHPVPDSKAGKHFDGNINRYWLSENLNNKIYASLRDFAYEYHRNGLDQMADNSAKARKFISDRLPSIAQVDIQRIGSMFPLIFFTAKRDELISIFSKADNREKNDAINILSQIDPG